MVVALDHCLSVPTTIFFFCAATSLHNIQHTAGRMGEEDQDLHSFDQHLGHQYIPARHMAFMGEAIMNLPPLSISQSEAESQVDARILALQYTQRRMMFSDLAKALSDCTWNTLFGALGRLSRQRHVELVPHRWDYEINFLCGRPHKLSPLRTPRMGDHYGHDKRTHV